MADPSRATIQTEWANAIKVLEETRQFGNVNSDNLLALLNTLQLSYAGDYLDDAETAVEGIRGSVANVVSQDTAAALQLPFLRQYLKSVVNRTDLSSIPDMWAELYKYFIDNSLRVASRVMTYGTPTAVAGNVGTMQFVRLTKDKYNFNIESGYGDSKRILCVVDQNTGSAQGNELWQITGQARARDELQRSGSGLQGTVSGLTIDDSIVQNAGFRSYSGTAAAPTGLTGWTSSAGDSSSIYTIDETNYFRVAPSDGSTSSALSLAASTILSQKLTVTGAELSDDVPYLLAVIWNRTVGTGVGTLTARMGNVATSVSVSGAQSGWQVTLVPNPMGQSAWYRQFAENDLDIQVQWARTSGTILVGEVLFVPGTFFDGSFFWGLPTSATWVAPRVRDSFTFADGESASGGVNQRWFSRAGYGYLPHSVGSSITFADV